MGKHFSAFTKIKKIPGRFWITLGILVILLVLPLTVIIAGQQQQQRSLAAENVALAVDTHVGRDQTTSQATIASPIFSTHQSGEMVVAFLASDGPKLGGQTFSSVTGGGLTFTLAKRANSQPGTAEVWYAYAPNVLNNVTITATRGNGKYQGMIDVVTFIGSRQSLGAANANSATKGAPLVSLTTTVANSWIWAVGNDWDKSVARTVGPNQIISRQFVDTKTGDTFWSQQQQATLPLAGTLVNMNDTAPTTDKWNMVAVEILPIQPIPTPILYSLWNNTSVPTNVAASDAQAVELGVKFKSQVDGFINGIRYYKSATNTGIHTGSLWTNTGQLLSTATFSNETETGWQQVIFSTPVAISANTVYVASYHTDTGYYSGDNNYFVNGIGNNPLYAFSDSEAGGNGVYAYGVSRFPTQSYQASNYWVDVIFQTNSVIPSVTLSSTPSPVTTSTPIPTDTTNVLNLPRIPWEGGPSYYAKYPALVGTEWVSDAFFPIGYWGAYVNEQSRIVHDKDLGINTIWNWYAPVAESPTWIRQAGVWNMGAAFSSGNGIEQVGTMITDEADMWGGPGWGTWTGKYPGEGSICSPESARCGYTIMDNLEATLPNGDGKLRYVNYGKGALMWESDAEAKVFYNGGDTVKKWNQDIASGDLYFYTDDNIGSEAVNWFGIPSAEVRRAANYGEVLMSRQRHLSGLDNGGVPRIPLGVVVELGGQGTNLKISIDANQVEGAVWSTLIHEARFVNYFSHAFANTTQNPGSSDVLNDSAYAETQAKVKTINTQVKQLASVLNKQSYQWTFNPNLSTMLKEKNGSFYIFAMQKRQNTSGTYTFTLPTGIQGSTVEVLYENRFLPITNNTFSDSFATEYTHHIYKITP